MKSGTEPEDLSRLEKIKKVAVLWPLSASYKPGPPPGSESPSVFSPSGPPSLSHIAPLVASPGATQLTFIAPHSKKREDRAPIVSHAAQGQGCAILEGERGTGGRKGRTFPSPMPIDGPGTQPQTASTITSPVVRTISSPQNFPWSDPEGSRAL